MSFMMLFDLVLTDSSYDIQTEGSDKPVRFVANPIDDDILLQSVFLELPPQQQIQYCQTLEITVIKQFQCCVINSKFVQFSQAE